MRRLAYGLSTGICLLLFLGTSVPAHAQTAGCWTPSADTWWTTIILKTNDAGLCVVDPYGGVFASRIQTEVGFPVVWHVCNTCAARADVRLSNFTTAMTTLLPYMNPMAESANIVTKRGIDVGMQQWVINAQATNQEAHVGMHDYDIFVKLSTEAETAWRQFHPQLQIRRSGFSRKVLLLLGLAGAALGLVGFILGRQTRARR
jgi:hypothetical protein